MGLSGVWDHGGLEHRRTRHWGFVQHSMRRGLQVYDRVGEGTGKGVRKPAGEERNEGEKADKIEVASGVTVASLRRFEPR